VDGQTGRRRPFTILQMCLLIDYTSRELFFKGEAFISATPKEDLRSMQVSISKALWILSFGEKKNVMDCGIDHPTLTSVKVKLSSTRHQKTCFLLALFKS